jgi:hypothetical protein
MQRARPCLSYPPRILPATIIPRSSSSLIVQVFGRRHDRPIPALMRPATKKRQGTKSRWGIREGSGTLYRKMSRERNLPIEQFWALVRRERPHNLAVPARLLLNGDFVFCTACEFNNLRVAKMARLATPARSECRRAFSGMVRINFSRSKKSAQMRPTCFALLVKIFLYPHCWMDQ